MCGRGGGLALQGVRETRKAGTTGVSLWQKSGPSGGMFARRAPGALLLDYVPPEEPPSTPLGNALRIR